MPGCVLRISGPYIQLRRSIAAAPFDFAESHASRRNREHGPTVSEIRCTFNYIVSHANGDRVPVQVSDAEAFLSQYSDELRFLRAADGVEHACLDFGWDIPDTAVGQFTMFPYSLLDRCADLRIDLEVSVYLVDAPDKRA